MHETTVSLSSQSPDHARLVETALRPEAGDIDSDRTAVEISRTETVLELTIEANDAVALRAGQNTWLGLIEVAEEIHDIGRRFEQPRAQ